MEQLLHTSKPKQEEKIKRTTGKNIVSKVILDINRNIRITEVQMMSAKTYQKSQIIEGLEKLSIDLKFEDCAKWNYS